MPYHQKHRTRGQCHLLSSTLENWIAITDTGQRTTWATKAFYPKLKTCSGYGTTKLMPLKANALVRDNIISEEKDHAKAEARAKEKPDRKKGQKGYSSFRSRRKGNGKGMWTDENWVPEQEPWPGHGHADAASKGKGRRKGKQGFQQPWNPKGGGKSPGKGENKGKSNHTGTGNEEWPENTHPSGSAGFAQLDSLDQQRRPIMVSFSHLG